MHNLCSLSICLAERPVKTANIAAGLVALCIAPGCGHHGTTPITVAAQSSPIVADGRSSVLLPIGSASEAHPDAKDLTVRLLGTSGHGTASLHTDPLAVVYRTGALPVTANVSLSR